MRSMMMIFGALLFSVTSFASANKTFQFPTEISSGEIRQIVTSACEVAGDTECGKYDNGDMGNWDEAVVVKVRENARIPNKNNSATIYVNASSPTTWKGANLYSDISNATMTFDTTNLTADLDKDASVPSTITVTERSGEARGAITHVTLNGDCHLASDLSELNCTYTIVSDGTCDANNLPKKIEGTFLRVDLAFKKSDNKINSTVDNR